MTRRYAPLFTFLLGAQAAAPPQKNAVTDSLDAEVKEFRMSALETKLQTMQSGPERDLFAGVLANRSGRIDDSILLLNRALPGIRESQPKRAALALETLADDYTKSFRYADAARAYDDLLAHFPGQLDRGGTRDDSDLAHLLQGVPSANDQFPGTCPPKDGAQPHRLIGYRANCQRCSVLKLNWRV